MDASLGMRGDQALLRPICELDPTLFGDAVASDYGGPDGWDVMALEFAGPGNVHGPNPPVMLLNLLFDDVLCSRG